MVEAMRLLDRGFKYVPSMSTDVGATWRRFGFRPTTERERRARQRDEVNATEEATTTSAPPQTPTYEPPARSEQTNNKTPLKLAVGK
jgi:hypothetical protein